MSATLSLSTAYRPASGIAMDGGMMFWAGLCYGTASLSNYLVMSGYIHLLHPAMIGLIWMGATAAFMLFGVILKVGSDRLLLQQPAVKRFRAIWTGLIVGAAVLIAALMIMMAKFDLGSNASFIVSPIALGVYGIGWRVAAVMTGSRWPNLLTMGCFAGAIGLAALAGTAAQSLAYSLCLVVFAVIPGLALLLRQQTPEAAE
ncbi:hypothetical protein [Asticcacaulis sp. 201]|uniref:hypothetical protein n=1 Tax=Asticcacaulis sp. 201 TaxID=3028787 RepID=UPI002915C8D1|nr:hypothetical protein [Asticcacaulis sp. 201]MDV6332232.1 hypothetical protein [Asticcacaulis sp. 201]